MSFHYTWYMTVLLHGSFIASIQCHVPFIKISYSKSNLASPTNERHWKNVILLKTEVLSEHRFLLPTLQLLQNSANYITVLLHSSNETTFTFTLPRLSPLHFSRHFSLINPQQTSGMSNSNCSTTLCEGHLEREIDGAQAQLASFVHRWSWKKLDYVGGGGSKRHILGCQRLYTTEITSLVKRSFVWTMFTLRCSLCLSLQLI